MAMLRKALIASFIAKPKNREKGEVEMKNTECRRLSQGKVEAGPGEEVKGVECLVLKDEEQPVQPIQSVQPVQPVQPDQSDQSVEKQEKKVEEVRRQEG